MAHGAPDWTTKIEVHFSEGQAADEYAAGGAGNYAGTDTDYQTVMEWTVTTGRTGELKEILVISDDYAHTLVEVVIGSVTWCTDWSPTSPMPIIHEDLRLAAGTTVTVSAKSSDGTAIDVDAIIVAKEIA
jgi:hypothetical protein